MTRAEIRAIRYELINLLTSKMCLNREWAVSYSEQDLKERYPDFDDDRWDNGCAFCDGRQSLIQKDHVDVFLEEKRLRSRVTIADDNYFMVENHGINVNYCPVCGRHLPMIRHTKIERGSGNEQSGNKTEVKRNEEVSVSI